MKSTFRKCVLNISAIPNPTPMSKSDRHNVKPTNRDWSVRNAVFSYVLLFLPNCYQLLNLFGQAQGFEGGLELIEALLGPGGEARVSHISYI